MNFNNKQAEQLVVPEKQKILKLVGTDGNAFSLLGRSHEFNRRNKIYSHNDWNLIQDEATSGDYHHLLATLQHFFNVR